MSDPLGVKNPLGTDPHPYFQTFETKIFMPSGSGSTFQKALFESQDYDMDQYGSICQVNLTPLVISKTKRKCYTFGIIIARLLYCNQTPSQLYFISMYMF